MNLTLGQHLIIGNDLYLHPFFGVSYAKVERDFGNTFTIPILNPLLTGTLVGVSQSHFDGFGPIIGTDFQFPVAGGFSFVGGINTAFVNGNVDYSLNSSFNLGNSVTNYNRVARESSHTVPIINTNLGVRYSHPIKDEPYSAVVEAGYQVSDYMNSIGRIYPDNGYANNPAGNNPASFSRIASLGFSGPFLTLAILNEPKSLYNNGSDPEVYSKQLFDPGWMLNITGLYNKPVGSIKDLNYATLNTPTGSSAVHTDTRYHWGGSIDLGYLFAENNTDVQIEYTHLDTDDSNELIAGPQQSISSINASGPATVVFGRASSKIDYKLDRVDVTGGKYFGLHHLLFRLYTGISFAHIIREQSNNYLDGQPGTTTFVKFPRLKSDFFGVGPVFGVSGQVPFSQHVSLVMSGNVGVLVGNNKATLSQDEFNIVGVPSFTRLTTQHKRYIVPDFTSNIGLRFSTHLAQQNQLQLTAGFRYSEYFKAINLLYPTFRTGLEQTNTNFAMFGPYVTLSIKGLQV